MAQITNIITIHEYNKMTAEQRAALGGENLLAVVQQDWEEARIQAAIAAMNGYQSAPIIPGCDPNPSQQEVARWSVQLADALIAELQKKQD